MVDRSTMAGPVRVSAGRFVSLHILILSNDLDSCCHQIYVEIHKGMSIFLKNHVNRLRNTEIMTK